MPFLGRSHVAPQRFPTVSRALGVVQCSLYTASLAEIPTPKAVSVAWSLVCVKLSDYSQPVGIVRTG